MNKQKTHKKGKRKRKLGTSIGEAPLGKNHSSYRGLPSDIDRITGPYKAPPYATLHEHAILDIDDVIVH